MTQDEITRADSDPQTGAAAAAPAAVVAPGRCLGAYEIVARVGAGGMGEVFRARDRRLGREVAVKILPAHKLNANSQQRFLQEARTASRVNHPNIVAIHDVGEQDGIPYIVMEYVAGKALAEAIPRAGWPAAVVLDYARQITAALVTAHGAGIVHRDLKPGNIMLTAEGTIKVLDFGLAKRSTADGDEETAVAAETWAGTILGTAAYMSPEQALGRRSDARSDIFSQGLVLYEMLTGQRAFGGGPEGAGAFAATLAAILTQEPAPLRQAAPGTPVELERVVMRCLRKDAGERYPTAAELLADLERCAPMMGRRSAAASVSVGRAETPSIAVLPFTNLSADADSDYFSEGLAEEILNALTQIPGLRVVARASAFAFRNRGDALAEIAAKLRVESVLQGSVRRAGQRLRVTAQLIDVRDATQLWSDRYDREMADVFAIQDEMARAIVDKLKVRWQGSATQPLVKAYTRNPEAHNLYLKGVYYGNRFNPADWAKARELLEQAVALEPNHARAWVHLAEYRIHQAAGGEIAPAVAMPQAADAARRALAADGGLADAQVGLGLIEAFYEHRWRDGLERIEAAASLPGTTWSQVWSANVYWSHGRFDAVERTLRRAVDLDPLAFVGFFLLARFYSARGDGASALHYALEALSLIPNAGSFAMMGVAHGLLGHAEESVEWLEKARRAAPFFPQVGHLARAYVRVGRRAEAEGLMRDLERGREHHYVAGTAVALCAMGLDQPEQALDWLERAAEEHDFGLGFLPGSGDFEVLRGHPRFARIVQRVGLPTGNVGG